MLGFKWPPARWSYCLAPANGRESEFAFPIVPDLHLIEQINGQTQLDDATTIEFANLNARSLAGSLACCSFELVPIS